MVSALDQGAKKEGRRNGQSGIYFMVAIHIVTHPYKGH